MSNSYKSRTLLTGLIALVALGFGIATIKVSAEVLFIDGVFRKSMGDYVSFVVWFNFVAGFFYIAAGVGIWLHHRWAANLSVALAVATFFIGIFLGFHILNGGDYEFRTIAALIFRTVVWAIIAFVVNFLEPP